MSEMVNEQASTFVLTLQTTPDTRVQATSDDFAQPDSAPTTIMFTRASAVRATQSTAAAPRTQQISSATLPTATPAASVQQLSDFELRMATVLTAAAALSDGSGEPTNGGGQRAVSGQRQWEKGMSETDIQW